MTLPLFNLSVEQFIHKYQFDDHQTRLDTRVIEYFPGKMVNVLVDHFRCGWQMFDDNETFDTNHAIRQKFFRLLGVPDEGSVAMSLSVNYLYTFIIVDDADSIRQMDEKKDGFIVLQYMFDIGDTISTNTINCNPTGRELSHHPREDMIYDLNKVSPMMIDHIRFGRHMTWNAFRVWFGIANNWSDDIYVYMDCFLNYTTETDPDYWRGWTMLNETNGDYTIALHTDKYEEQNRKY